MAQSGMEKLRSMREGVKKQETKLLPSNRQRADVMTVRDLEDGPNVLRVVKHNDDEIPFAAFRSTYLEVEEPLTKLNKWALAKVALGEDKIKKQFKLKESGDVSKWEDDQVDELREALVDELGEEHTEKVSKRIFISKVHGNPEVKDVVEEYIKFASSKHIPEMTQDPDERAIKIGHIRGYSDKAKKWHPGIMPNTAYVAYVYDEKGELRRFEMYEKHMDEIEKLISSLDDPDEPFETDPFSDPEAGVPLVFTKGLNEKKKTEITIVEKKNTSRSLSNGDFLAKFALTQDQMDEVNSKTSLTELFSNVYKKRDFELALAGLMLFDEKNNIGAFENSDLQDIVEEIAEFYSEEEEDEKPTKKEASKKAESKEPVKKFTKKVEKEEVEKREPKAWAKKNVKVEEPEEEEEKEDDLKMLDDEPGEVKRKRGEEKEPVKEAKKDSFKEEKSDKVADKMASFRERLAKNKKD